MRIRLFPVDAVGRDRFLWPPLAAFFLPASGSLSAAEHEALALMTVVRNAHEG